MTSIIYLIVFALVVNFTISALSGVVMFIRDITKYGKPHTKFEAVPSIEAYNKRLDEIEELGKTFESEETPKPAEPIELDL